MNKMTPLKHKTPNYRLKVLEEVVSPASSRSRSTAKIVHAAWEPVPLRADRKDLAVTPT